MDLNNAKKNWIRFKATLKLQWDKLAPLRLKKIAGRHGHLGLLLVALMPLGQAYAYTQPYIQNFSPASGPVGTSVTVTGSGFTGTTQVQVNNVNATYNVVNDGTLTLTVPNNATSGQIAIINPSYAAWSGSGFTVTGYPQPYIQNFTPASGPVGTVVTVTGSGFTGATQVQVGNINAAYNVVNDGTLTLTVPNNATSGQIAIINPSHAAWSGSGFTVTAGYPQPYIQNFTPSSGPVGTVVTVTGSGFTGATQVQVNNVNATYTVVNDGTLSLTVPSGTTSGQIAIFNPAHAAWSGSGFTVTASAPPTLSSFSPTSGIVGTTVTITGSNFAYVTAVKFNGSSASYTVNSATSISAAVPTSATSGTISVTTNQGTATSASSFTVSSGAAPTISSFSPTSGGLGTVVTITGSGFTGVTAVRFNGSSASYTVSSATSISATVPTSATSGTISVATNNGTATSASSFTVSGSPPPTLSLRVQGNRFINAAGGVVQLRGVNYSGYENTAIQGWSPNDPSGAQAGGQPGGPKWSAVTAWKANTVRLPLNEASWLGYSCTDTSGVVHNPDPGGNYKSAVQTFVTQANAAGLYVIIDLHWTAPGNTCPMLQTQMANADHSIAFWTSVSNMFKNNPAVLFELFNEPFFAVEFSGDAWTYMMKGTGGSFSGYEATSGSGAYTVVKQSWAIASYQAMLNAVRATGATNVVLVGTMQYSQDLSAWLANKPTDPLNQMAAAWHPYPTYATDWGTPGHAQPNYANYVGIPIPYNPDIFTCVQNIQAAGIPVIATETGDLNVNGTVGSPMVSNVTTWADQNGVSVVGWAWDVWQDRENVLIKDIDGTPTDGYGVVFRNWLLAH